MRRGGRPVGRWIVGACAAMAFALAPVWVLPAVAGAETARYTVHFDSTMVDEFPGNENEAHGKYTNEYTATVPLTSAAKGSPYTGSVTGSYARTEGVAELASTCLETPSINKQIDHSGNPAPFKVVSFTPATSAGASPVLTINVGMPTETYLNEVTVPACNLAPPTAIPNWWSLWGASHKASLLTSEPNEFQLMLSKGSGETAATATYSGVVEQQGNLIGSESTTISVTEGQCVVPDVVREPSNLAREAIEEAGCTVGAVSEKSSTTVALGEVISSSPAAGANVAAGTAVSLVIAKGGKVKRECIVPNLKGDSLAAAQRALKKAECGLGKVKKAKSLTLAKGKVVSSTPKRGSKQKAGYKVALTISNGPGKKEGKKSQCKVPGLAGDSLVAAKAALEKAGCSLGRVSIEKSTSLAAGKVVSSKPNKGTKLKAGAKVGLVISIGGA